MEAVLPFPPSVNHYWRYWRGRAVISKAGREFRQHVCQLLPGGAGGKPPYTGRVGLCMDAFPPDRRRRDLDNILKASLDSLGHAGVYEDDSQIDLLLVRRRDVSPGGQIAVRVFPLATLNICPLCGQPFEDFLS